MTWSRCSSPGTCDAGGHDRKFRRRSSRRGPERHVSALPARSSKSLAARHQQPPCGYNISGGRDRICRATVSTAALLTNMNSQQAASRGRPQVRKIMVILCNFLSILYYCQVNSKMHRGQSPYKRVRKRLGRSQHDQGGYGSRGEVKKRSRAVLQTTFEGRSD
jgi:hypothetical protein